MRSFLHHNPFRKTNTPNRSTGNNNFIPDILDTDEDRVMNQYGVYIDYVKRFKKELIKGSEALMGYRRNIAAQG